MSIVSGIERLAKDFTEKTHASGNEEVRKALLKAVQKLCISLQSPGQLVEEHLFGVSSYIFQEQKQSRLTQS